MERVLVVEDCNDLQALIRTEFENKYRVSAAKTLSEARAQIQESQFDAVLLDVGMPDGSGFEFCTWLRSRRDTQNLPVLFLTGKSQPTEKVMGFALGADDYVVKPFDPSELKARLHVRMKSRKFAERELLSRGPFQFDRVLQKASVVSGSAEKDLGLTPFEFRVLYFLASREPEIFSRSRLLKHVIDAKTHVNEETIYTHVSALRRKLGNLAGHLESVARAGYRFHSVIPSGAKPGN